MGYELPEELHPETIKFCIEVPNEFFYLQAFWGALWTLTRPYNHADDDDHTALEVAAVWRDLWFANHTGFIERQNMCGGCCQQEIDILVRIFQQNNLSQSFILNLLDDGETANSFAPDAPENYDSNDGDEFPFARTRALCAAVNQYVLNILSGVIRANAQSDLAGDVLELLPPFGIIFGIVDALVDVAGDILAGLAGDSEAIADVVCHMLSNLNGQPVTHPIFKDSVDVSAFDPLSNAWQIAIIIDVANASVANWRAFTGLLPDLYEQISNGGSVDCPCVCDDDLVLSDWYGTGTIITPVGDCIYRFEQLTPIYETPPEIPRWYHSVRDDLGRCINIEASPNPTYPTNPVSDHWFTDCNGTSGSGVGGGGGEVLRLRWRGSEITHYKITLASS